MTAIAVERTGVDLRPLAWAVLLAAGLFVLDIGGWYGYINDQPSRIATQIAAYVVIGGWLLVAALRPGWLPRTPLARPIVAAAAVFALTGLLSQRSRLSIESTLAGLAVTAIFLLVSRLASEPWFRTRLRVILVGAPIVVAVAYVVQVALTWVEWWNLVGAISLPPPLRPGWAGLLFGSPNLIATVLILSGPLSLAIIWRRHRRATIALGAVFTLAIVLSGSRSALVGLAFVAVVVVVAGIRRNGGLARFRDRRWAAALLAGSGLGAALVPVLAVRFTQGGELLRLDLWRSALTIFSQHPLFGAGPGTWVQLKLEATPAGATNLVLPHAHDLYVQTLAEVGIVGSMALVGLVVLIGRRLLSGTRSRDRGLAVESCAGRVGLVAIAGQSLTDDVVNLPAVCLLLVLVVGWIDGGLVATRDASEVTADRSARGWRLTWPLGRIVGALALAAVVVSILPIAAFDRAALAADEGNAAAATGDWTSALASYDDALALDPGMTLYAIERATALGRVGRTAEARTQLTSATEADQLPMNLVSLAALDASAGDCSAALGHAELAVQRGPNDAAVALNAGAIAERCANDVEAAVAWYGAGLAAMPQLAGDPWWNEPVRSGLRTAILARASGILAAAGDRARMVVLAAWSGDLDGASQLLAALPAPCVTCQAVIDWQSGDHPAAIAGLRADLAAHPLEWTAAAALARYSWFDGDVAGAQKYQRWAEIVQGDSAPGTVTAPSRIAIDAPGGQLLPGLYPWAVYLRDGPSSLWPPGLITPVLAR
jgi:tetratricopeptide (TPR) repeat protein